jgi:hypothetical protein
MGLDNIRNRPDLTPLFGSMPKEVHEHIMNILLGIDDRLCTLAREASQHIGVPYQHTGLKLFVRENDAEISGGPSGNAGDIWFEVEYSFDETSRKLRAPPWTVDSRIVIFCADLDPLARGYSCTHDLVALKATTNTPISTVETMAAHIDALTLEIRKRTPAVFTQSLHADLERLAGAGGQQPPPEN